MNSCIDLAKPGKLLHRNSSADEVEVALKSLNVTAETLKNLSEALRHQLLLGKLFFNSIIKFEAEHKSRFKELRCLKTRLERLFKPFDFMRNQTARNIGVHLPLFLPFKKSPI
ncbi:hypothetical protein TNCT_12691 [Trichonephila clavata]|uniref:Uncharacterized protein n=1 Tax=Trichonephila clavata TaxID=2740835 RepID=A0A8X6LMD8_TRICU|nr:hypothetical protein TNCT_12691 [Trichonephila clavata]